MMFFLRLVILVLVSGPIRIPLISEINNRQDNTKNKGEFEKYIENTIRFVTTELTSVMMSDHHTDHNNISNHGGVDQIHNT